MSGKMSHGEAIWRTAVTLGEIKAHVIGNNRRIDELRREMVIMFKASKKPGIPLWGHIAAMGMISALSALGLMKPETALALLRLIGKAAMGS